MHAKPVENDHYVCYDCCVAPLLKDLVVRHGEISTCSLCGAKKVKCAGTGTDDFLLAAKALIRYHFGEWQYHSKLGMVFKTRLKPADSGRLATT